MMYYVNPAVLGYFFVCLSTEQRLSTIITLHLPAHEKTPTFGDPQNKLSINHVPDYKITLTVQTCTSISIVSHL